MSREQKGFTLFELAKLTNSQLVGDKNHLITGVNSLEDANLQEASFLANPRYEEVMKNSSAGVICVNAGASDP